MSTPHNAAEKSDIAKIVLMPGDPLRAQFIAEHFLEDARRVSAVRNVYAYTGMYDGRRVSVMASGMGMPSIGIYSYELYKFYNVDAIIRIGSAGAYKKDLNLYDLVLADGAFSESSFAKMQNGDTSDVQRPSETLNAAIRRSCERQKIYYTEGLIHSSDVFYSESGMPDPKRLYEEKGCLCVEMESFALFSNARVLGKQAACLLTISDNLVTGEVTTAEQRQNGFTNMMKAALGAAEEFA